LFAVRLVCEKIRETQAAYLQTPLKSSNVATVADYTAKQAFTRTAHELPSAAANMNSHHPFTL
jgi:hypothetical protein